MYAICGSACLSYTVVAEWLHMFRMVGHWMTELWRLGVVHVANRESIACVENVAHEDRRWIFIASWWNVTWITMQLGVVGYLDYHRLCTHLVPCRQPHVRMRAHTTQQGVLPVGYYWNICRCRDTVLKVMHMLQILLGNKTWCHNFKPTGKPAGMHWGPSNNNFMSWAIAGKVWLTVFLEIERALFLHFRSCNNTVIANCYSQILQNLHTKIKKNVWVKSLVALSWWIMMSMLICLAVQDQPNAMRWEVPKHPAYCLGYLPCNFHVLNC